MKNFSKLVLILSLASVAWAQTAIGGSTAAPPQPTVYGANASVNGGFNGNASSWTLAGCATYDGSVNHGTLTGAGSLKVDTCGAGNVNFASQNISIGSKEAYIVSFSVTTDTTFNGTFSVVHTDNSHGSLSSFPMNGRQEFAVGANSSYPTPQWVDMFDERYIYILVHGSDTNAIALRVSNQTAGAAWVDDIQVRPVAYPLRVFSEYPNYRGLLWNDRTPPARWCAGTTVANQLCWFADIDSATRATDKFTYTLATAAGCGSGVLYTNTITGPLATQPFQITPAQYGARSVGDVMYLCPVLKDAANVTIATYPDLKYIYENAAFRAGLMNYYDADGKYYHNQIEQPVYGTYDRWSATFRNTGPGALSFTNKNSCTPAQSSPANCYKNIIRGPGVGFAPVTTGTALAPGLSAIAGYGLSKYSIVLGSFTTFSGANPSAPKWTAPGAGCDVGNTCTDNVTPYLDALATVNVTHAQIFNNFLRCLATETEVCTAPTFTPSLTKLNTGSMNIDTLYLKATAVEWFAPSGSVVLTYGSTLPATKQTVDFTVGACQVASHGVNCAVTFTAPSCINGRQQGWWLFASLDDITYHQQFPSIAGAISTHVPIACGSTVTLNAFQTTGISPPSADNTFHTTSMAWANGVTDPTAWATWGATVRGHSAMAAFYTADEAIGPSVPTACYMYRTLKDQANGVPVFVVLQFAPGGVLWRDCADVIANDPYGFGQNAGPDEFASGAGTRSCTNFDSINNSQILLSTCQIGRPDFYVDAIARATNGSRPIWTVTQQWARGVHKAYNYYTLKTQDMKAMIACLNWGIQSCGAIHWGEVSGTGLEKAWYSDHNTDAWVDQVRWGAEFDALKPVFLRGFTDTSQLGHGSVITSVTQTVLGSGSGGAAVSATTACVNSPTTSSIYTNATNFPDGGKRIIATTMANGDIQIIATNMCDGGYDVNFTLASVPAGALRVEVDDSNGQHRASLPLTGTSFTDSWAASFMGVYHYVIKAPRSHNLTGASTQS